MSNINDIQAKFKAQANNELKKHHKHSKDRKSKHSKESKDTEPEKFELGAQQFVKRGGATTDKQQFEGTYHLQKILQYLEELCEESKPPVSEEELSRHFRFDIHKNKELYKKLKEHPKVDYKGKMFSYRPMISIEDKNQLMDQLQRLRAVKTSELKGAYKGFEKDLKQLVDEKKIDCFNSNENRVKLYYCYDQDLLKLQAPQEFIDLWVSVEIPDSKVERETMLHEYQAQPFHVVDSYPTLEQDQVEDVKTRKKRASTKSTNAQLLEKFDEINARDD